MQIESMIGDNAGNTVELLLQLLERYSIDGNSKINQRVHHGKMLTHKQHFPEFIKYIFSQDKFKILAIEALENYPNLIQYYWFIEDQGERDMLLDGFRHWFKPLTESDFILTRSQLKLLEEKEAESAGSSLVGFYSVNLKEKFRD